MASKKKNLFWKVCRTNGKSFYPEFDVKARLDYRGALASGKKLAPNSKALFADQLGPCTPYVLHASRFLERAIAYARCSFLKKRMTYFLVEGQHIPNISREDDKSCFLSLRVVKEFPDRASAVEYAKKNKTWCQLP